MTSREEQLDSLMREGFEALDYGELDEALAIGEQLRELRHSSAFEIVALARLAQGRLDEAVTTLEEGVAVAPEVWILWQLLGNCYSERSEFAAAHRAYDKAVACPQAELGTIALNRSVALGHEERWQQALEMLREVEDPELAWTVAHQELHLLNALGRHAEVVEKVRALDVGAVDPEEHGAELAGIHAELGDALQQQGASDTEVLEEAWKALRLDKSNDLAAWLVREVRGEKSPAARYYRLLVRGTWHEEDETGQYPGFFASYHVVADSPEAALDFARQFEPEQVRESLHIDELEVIEEKPGGPSGVYWAYPGYAFFSEDEDEEDGEDDDREDV